MKTRKHGHGMTHEQVVTFSCRLAKQVKNEVSPHYTYTQGFIKGWKAACKYFAHELRKKLRECELLNEI